jgi:hypothetical protein
MRKADSFRAVEPHAVIGDSPCSYRRIGLCHSLTWATARFV